MDQEAAWQLVANATQIFIASGKKILEYRPTAASKEEIMAKIVGRTGNLRAPTIRRGTTLYIGYNTDLYQHLTGP
jgi:arsenate reductase-like glutaredoxin family protein